MSVKNFQEIKIFKKLFNLTILMVNRNYWKIERN